jgi:hypothetical protein
MPQAVDLTVQDQIPDDLTFSPVGASFKETVWECRDYADTHAGRPKLTLNQSHNKAATHRFSELRLVIPVETTDSTTGAVTVVDVERAYARFTTPLQVADEEHDRLWTVFLDVCSQADVKGAVVNGANFH